MFQASSSVAASTYAKIIVLSKKGDNFLPFLTFWHPQVMGDPKLQ